MTQYSAVGSYIIFEEVQTDLLGRLCRAGEFDISGVNRTVWLRIFDGPGIPAAAIGAKADEVSQIASVYKASNSASNPLLSLAGEIPLYAFDHMPAQPMDRIFAKVKDEGFPVPVDNALLIMEKIALALAGALAVDIGGAKRLFHGFLLPAFILVSNEGEAQVSGFGVGEEVLDIVDNATARDAAAPFLAPEVMSARNASKKSDVYSLGAILFQLLTGDPLPIELGERAQALVAPTMAYDYEPIPADIMALLKKALGERPEERFSSAADFKKELDKLLYGGNYSPTTFNLALFMDRLFRNEIEAEEKVRSAEDAVDHTPYLAPEPEPEPEPEPMVMHGQAAPKGGSGKMIGIVVAVVVVAAIGVTMMIKSGGSEAAAQQAEILAQLEQRLAQLDEREAKFAQREQEIEDLQGKLASISDTEDDEQAKKQADELRRKLRAAEEQKRREEKQLADQRRRLQQQQQQANIPTVAPSRPTPKPTVAPIPTATPVATAAAAAAVPTQIAALATPTPVPTPTPVRVTRDQMIERTDVDTAPQVVQSSKVIWPRAATRSRKRGVIILSALVNANGRVEDVKVLRADDQGFGIPVAAEDAVEKYTFKPATKSGVEVKTWTTVTIPYNFQ